jgi:hypothetical protein
MHNRSSIFTFVLMSALCVASTISHAQSEAKKEIPKPSVKTLMLIPATKPLVYTLENRHSSVPADASQVTGVAKTPELLRLEQSDKFDDSMKALGLSLEVELNASVKTELEKLGYTVTTIENLPRRIRQPDVIDYNYLKFSEDALVHVFFSDVGFYMPRNGSGYYPRLNVSGVMMTTQPLQTLFKDTVYYGVDANEKDVNFFFGKDVSKAYKSFADLMANFDAIRESNRLAVALIAKRLADNIHGKLK